MIRCLPMGICSWDYLLEGDGHVGEARFRTFGEGGEILVDGRWLEIRKEGFLSGTWSARDPGGEIARAWKTNPFTRTIEGSGPGGDFRLEAESAFGRTMDLQGAGGRAVISPDHPFTRRATFSGVVPDFTTACFAFWLTALLWRRNARASHQTAAS